MKKPTLIVHVGMGKTGTSSIQQTLQTSEKVLTKAKIKYLGYDLDYTKGPKLKGICFKPGEKDEENHKVLTKKLLLTLEHYTGKYDKLIVSNERLYHRGQYVDLFKSIEQAGYEVTIIAYVRRPDLWARSAHAQWGIKHKTTEGNVKTFNQWATDQKLKYSKHLSLWAQQFPDHIIIRNYEEIQDVVSDFCSIINVQDFTPATSNKTVGNEDLALWAVYNSMKPAKVFPNEFTEFLESMGLDKRDSFNIVALLPSQLDLDNKFETCQPEIVSFNEIFKKYNVPEFDNSLPKTGTQGIEPLKMIQSLSEIVFAMEERIKILEQEPASPKKSPMKTLKSWFK